jgi:predicted transcriptional regulator
MTRLESFLKANDIRPFRLIRAAGVSRQYLARLRYGKADPTRHMMARLAMASGLLLNRTVQPSELFDLWDTGL